jgi:hypothetical protein
MEAYLLDGEGDVRVGECQVLKSPDKAPDLSRISNRRSESSGDLSLCVHRH